MMKKVNIVLQLFLLLILVSSCSTSKEARGYKKTIDGNWQLQTVVTEGIMGKIKAQVFNEADFNCFVGSSWHFNSNNSLGSYTISQNAKECEAIKRDIRWSVYEPAGLSKQLQFKRLDSKLKEIDENSGGFRFTIIQADNNSMQLKSEFTFENKPAAFIYNFVRI
ncbi:MAG: hypothetical protein ABIN36_06865 [Ferruginibacter sp.]